MYPIQDAGQVWAGVNAAFILSFDVPGGGMEVLLVQDVPGIGKAGQTKKVSDGYARNFLLARHLAVVATPTALNQATKLREASVKREAETRDEARTLAGLLDQARLTFHMKAGENDLTLTVPAGDTTSGVCYDYLRLELQEK